MNITIKAETALKRISIWNGIFNLTKKELEILAALIDVHKEGSIASNSNKKQAASIVGIEDYNTLNNYIKRLKDKKAIIYKSNNYSLHPLLKENSSDVRIQIIK